MNKPILTKEPELVDLVRKGQKKAFQQLYEIYAPRLYQFSYSYFKNEIDAEELVQEVFIKIWDNREWLDSSKNFKSYIFKITGNAIYYFIRKKNIERAYLDFARMNYKLEENQTWDSVVFNEMQENLNQLVSQLPEQQQKIFHLSKEKGHSNDEICKELNLSKRTVENHLYRAIAYLKQHFKSESLISVLFFFLFYS